jgi:hypothetical protein
MSVWPNDADLLAALKDALREAEAVPPRFVETGKAAYARHARETSVRPLSVIRASERPRR